MYNLDSLPLDGENPAAGMYCVSRDTANVTMDNLKYDIGETSHTHVVSITCFTTIKDCCNRRRHEVVSWSRCPNSASGRNRVET